jgi:hypothetical protein
MWEWVYSGMKLEDGRIAVEIKTADYRAPDLQKEWLSARVELAIPAVPSEPMIRVEALRTLRTLVAGEIDRIEILLADGVR